MRQTLLAAVLTSGRAGLMGLMGLMGLAVLMSVDAARAALPRQQIYSSTGKSGQYVAVSRDRVLNENLLDLTELARRQLAEPLSLPRNWQHLVRLIPYEAENEQLKQFPLLKAFLDDGKLSFEVHFPTNTPNAQEEFLRTLVYTILYDALLQDRGNFDDGEPLPVIPVWLAEGVLQQIVATDPRRWHQVVHRAVSHNRAPALEEVLGWKSLAGDALMRAWQQAFSYQLTHYLMSPAHRGEFQQWLRTQGIAEAPAFATLRPMVNGEIRWRHVLSLSGEQRTDLVFDFDQTATRFAKTQSIRLPGNKGHAERVTSLTKLAEHHQHPALPKAVENKLTELTDLEMRAHFSWRPLIAWQRAGLSRLVTGDRDSLYDYGKAMAKSAREQRALSQLNDQLADYFNWFLVTKVPPLEGSHFPNYFRVRAELESFESPQDDPLRSPFIQVRRR